MIGSEWNLLCETFCFTNLTVHTKMLQLFRMQFSIQFSLHFSISMLNFVKCCRRHVFTSMCGDLVIHNIGWFTGIDRKGFYIINIAFFFSFWKWNRVLTETVGSFTRGAREVRPGFTLTRRTKSRRSRVAHCAMPKSSTAPTLQICSRYCCK